MSDVFLGEGRVRGRDSVVIGPGLSISSFENVAVRVSFTKPIVLGLQKDDTNAVRIICGYLNDGTSYFRRATFTSKNSVEFRLRNINLLKQSIQFNNSLFVAYVFFLVDIRKEGYQYESSVPVSTVTVEIL